MSKIKIVLLDWNGHLLDDKDSAFGGVCAVFKHFGIKPPDPGLFFDEIGPNFLACYQKFGLPPHLTAEDLGKVWTAHYGDFSNDGKIRPGARELLQFLRKHKLGSGIISAEASSILARRLGQLNLRILLDFAWGDCLDKESSIRKALSYANLKAHEAVYVDDNYHGLLQAKKSGVTTIGFTGGWQTPGRVSQANPDFLSRTMFETRDIINKLQNGKGGGL